jgi:hypothetical protein
MTRVGKLVEAVRASIGVRLSLRERSAALRAFELLIEDESAVPIAISQAIDRLSPQPESLPITRNAARCKLCGDTIESKSVHDFVTCTCGNLHVDGGHEYLKRGWKEDSWEDLSEPPEHRPQTVGL